MDHRTDVPNRYSTTYRQILHVGACHVQGGTRYLDQPVALHGGVLVQLDSVLLSALDLRRGQDSIGRLHLTNALRAIYPADKEALGVVALETRPE
jgi:hypothetical protein